MLTQARLKEVLHYNPETGEFFRRVMPGTRSELVGKRAGGLHHKGYWYIRVDGKRYGAHRLAWLYVHGKFPDKDLDHKNRDRSSCRIADLREATNGQNQANSKSKGRSGLKGAYPWPNGKYCAKIVHDGKHIHLGTFATAAEAHAVYCEAAKRLHGDFFHAG